MAKLFHSGCFADAGRHNFQVDLVGRQKVIIPAKVPRFGVLSRFADSFRVPGKHHLQPAIRHIFQRAGHAFHVFIHLVGVGIAAGVNNIHLPRTGHDLYTNLREFLQHIGNGGSGLFLIQAGATQHTVGLEIIQQRTIAGDCWQR